VRRGGGADVAWELPGGVHDLRAAQPHRRRPRDPDRSGPERRSGRASGRGGGVGLIGSAARRRLLVAAVAAIGWVALRPPDALAHARLIRSDPPDPCAAGPLPALPPLAFGSLPCAAGVVLSQAPGSVRLIFNEPVDLVGR